MKRLFKLLFEIIELIGQLLNYLVIIVQQLSFLEFVLLVLGYPFFGEIV